MTASCSCNANAAAILALFMTTLSAASSPAWTLNSGCKRYSLRMVLHMRGGSDSYSYGETADGISQMSAATKLKSLPAFMQQLAADGDDGDEAGISSTIATRGTAKEDSDFDDREQVTMSLEDLGEFDIKTQEGVDRAEGVLRSWHEMMRERDKNPMGHLQDHPRWKFVQEVEAFLQEADRGFEEAQEVRRNLTESFYEEEIVQRLQKKYPRNLTVDGIWDEEEVHSVLKDMDNDERERLKKEKGPYWMMQKDHIDAALADAARQDDTEFMRDLLLSGANAKDAPYEGGWPPLHWALYYRQHKAVRTLLEAGASPECPSSDNVTALQRACTQGDAEGVRILVAAGANVNARSSGELTALHYAAAYGSLDAAQALCELGADLLAEDEEGKTPYQTAVDNEEVETAQLLQSLQASHTAQTLQP